MCKSLLRVLWVSWQRPANPNKVLFESTALQNLEMVKQQLIALRNQNSQIAYLRTGADSSTVQLT